MIKKKKDFSCILHDTKTNEDIGIFNAQQIGEPLYSAGFVGGGVASALQSLTIMTEKKFDYKPLQHTVIIDGKSWILTSYTPSIRRKLGANNGKKIIYILNLE
jgi:hypothetical protein